MSSILPTEGAQNAAEAALAAQLARIGAGARGTAYRVG